MANIAHLTRLHEGVPAWNAWRKAHSQIQPDLSGADLSSADLNCVNLSHVTLSQANLNQASLNNANLWGANLREADLSRTKLTSADLRGANMEEANVRGATLTNADLSMSHLNYADLSEANLHLAYMSQSKLRGANLTKAVLTLANLQLADLNGANLNGAQMWLTHLASVDLSQVKGLETVQHEGNSHLSLDTIYKSRGQIPEVFLRGVGVPDQFIEYMRSLAGKAIEYYSCFISYSSKDQAFAERLYADLQAKNVRCWFAPEDLKIGDKFWERIDESIRLHDKLLVILSEHSVESDWVEDEVTRALEKERQSPEHTVLFPIRLDDAVMNARHAWASSIRLKRHIGDFCAWKDHDAYQKAFARLLRDLKAEPG